MPASKLLVDCLQQSRDLMLMTLSDFSDDDMLHRPCGKANHTTWQLGHLIVSSLGMISSVNPGVTVPAEKKAIFSKDAAASDDSSTFPKKAEMIAFFTDMNEKAIAWAGTLSDADAVKPGPEPLRQFAPTVGSIAAVIAMHTSMHLGQIQVIRRSLGKPVLF